MPFIERIRPWLMPTSVMACLVVILMPLPTVLMDLLLAGNIALATVILLTTIHVKSPLEFSVFPTLLLATTLSRLVLNIATTRLILTGAPIEGENAAGGVIQTFGQFVAGNQLEVGLVIFLILVVVQFVVITKGASRVSEVAARFTLDGMPGRQSAIDADLAAGVIDNKQATESRSALLAEADFFSAMDGASKFVRGDAVAGLVITGINIIGGLYLGVFVSQMGVADAASVYTKLTIGDGLVSQLPSLLISLAAGVLVTRGTRPTNLPETFVSQLFGNRNALLVAGAFLLVLMVTGLPLLPLLLLGSGCLIIASAIGREEKQQAEVELARRETEAASQQNAQKRVEDFLSVDPLEVAIGLGLLPLADPSRGGDLMQRIAGLRNQMAAEIGIVLPKVRVRDDATLADQDYEIRMHGDLIAEGTLRIDSLLATGDHHTTGQLQGQPTAHYADHLTAVWIPPADRQRALVYGYETHTAADVLSDHLERIARTYADELLSRDATKHLLDELQQIAPAMVNELVPDLMKISDVQKVLQGLLREGIPIRQLGIILETLSDVASQCGDTGEQIERVRLRLSRTICSSLRDASRTIHVATLDSSTLSALMNPKEYSSDVTCNAIRKAVKNLIIEGFPPTILVDPEHRRTVKHYCDEHGISTHVISSIEITPDTHIKQHAFVRLNETSAAA